METLNSLYLQPSVHLDQKEKLIKYSDFVHKELIQFSMADLQRSIPSMVDGLKPGQRKILFCSFKRNFVKEAKVAQFSGYVSEHSAYHHGEQSLASTIIGMAQDYVGSNNINLLQPNGQFGTRNLVRLTMHVNYLRILKLVMLRNCIPRYFYLHLYFATLGRQRPCKCSLCIYSAFSYYKIPFPEG